MGTFELSYLLMTAVFYCTSLLIQYYFSKKSTKIAAEVLDD